MTVNALRTAGLLAVFAATLALTACASEDEAAPEFEIPEYTVLDIVDQISGVRYGDVLVSTLQRDTPAGRRADVIKEIARREGLGEASLYCSRDAFRAAFSSSFAEEHPDALQTCYLGKLNGAQFTPGESTFP